MTAYSFTSFPSSPAAHQVALLETRLAEALSTSKSRAQEADVRGQELARLRQQLEAMAALLHKKEQYLDKVEQGVIRPLNKWYQVSRQGLARVNVYSRLQMSEGV